MSSDRLSIAEAVASIFRDLSSPSAVNLAEETGWNDELWTVLAESGFTTISVPEEAGGSGGDIADAAVVLKEAGRFAAPVPIAETGLLAGWAQAAAGMELSSGPSTVGVGHNDDSVEISRLEGSWQVRGRLHRVPWADKSEHIVVIGQHESRDFVARVNRADVEVTPGQNMAGESRDTVVLPGIQISSDNIGEAPDGVNMAALRLRGALARSVQMAGALARVADLTVRYTNEREQFGRPVARFQAVQRHLVRITEQAQVTGMAAETASLNAEGEPSFFDVAAAKIVAGEAASIAAAASHQAHGAIGMTKEYELGQLTRRLWAWRDEFGSEAYWSRVLGSQVAAAGAEEIWPRVSTAYQPSASQSA